jgi:glucose-6-phosphate 1-epimerase
MTRQSLDQLNATFATQPGVRFEAGNGGLIRAVLSADAGDAHVYLHGAHVSHFQPKGQPPVLFMSARSAFEHDKPIRGGVPICFPWFSNAGTPMHGFARLAEWTVASAGRQPDGSVALTLLLASDDWTKGMWPHDFVARFTVRVSATLEMALEVTNRSQADITFEEALHTYFAVSDIQQVQVHGLEGATYLDKANNMQPRQRDNQPLRFAAETDSNYPATTATCIIEDPGLRRRIRVEKHHSNTTVVWNPWIDKAKAMPDFGDDEWPAMLCIETANTGANRVSLSPGQSHTIRAVIRVEPM